VNIVHALESIIMLQQAVHIFITVLQRVNCPNNNSVEYELLTPPWNMRNTNTVPGKCTYHTLHIYVCVCVCVRARVCCVWGMVWCEPHRHITHHTDTPHTTPHTTLTHHTPHWHTTHHTTPHTTLTHHTTHHTQHHTPHWHNTNHTDTPHTTHNTEYNCLLALRPTQCRCKCSIGSLDVQSETHKTTYNYYPPLGIMWPLAT